MAPLETRVIADVGAFADIASEWDALVLRAERASPMLFHAWLNPWWAIYRETTPVRVVTVRQSGRLVGGLPLLVERVRGSNVGRLDRFLFAVDALLAPDQTEDVARALVGAVREGGMDALDLSGVAANGRLARGLASRGPSRVLRRFEAASLDLRDGFDAAYSRTVGSGTRRTHRRRLKQLAAEGEVSFVRHSTEPEVAAALDDAFRLHAARWAGGGDTSPFGPPAGRAFHRAALAGLSRDGRVRLVELRVDGVPISFQLCLLLGDTLFTYRVAYDPAFARYSPGALVLIEALRSCAAEGVTRVEFLYGDEDYKRELADGMMPVVRIVGGASDLRGLAFLAIEPPLAGVRERLRTSRHVFGAYDRARRLLGRSP